MDGDDDGFVLVKPRKAQKQTRSTGAAQQKKKISTSQFNYKATGNPNHLPRPTITPAQLSDKILAKRSDLEKSKFFANLRGTPVKRRKLIMLKPPIETLDKSTMVFFDPVVTDIDKQVIREFDVQIEGVNEYGKRRTTKTTVYYMPHCGEVLYSNLLWANWSPESLARIAVIGNSFDAYNTIKLATNLERTAPYLKEHPVKQQYLSGDIFNNTSIHIFPIHNLTVLASGYWEDRAEPPDSVNPEVLSSSNQKFFIHPSFITEEFTTSGECHLSNSPQYSLGPTLRWQFSMRESQKRQPTQTKQKVIQSFHPVVRSRSSFSLHALSSGLPVSSPGSVMPHRRHISKNSVGVERIEKGGREESNKTSSIIVAEGKVTENETDGVADLSALPKIVSKPTSKSRASSEAPKEHLEEEDGVLGWIANRGFSGVWSHPITRTCEHLLEIQFLRMDTYQFRLEYHTLHPSSRKSFAYRIFNTYLSRNASLPVQFPRDGPVSFRRIINSIKAGMESPDPSLFDELSLGILKVLEDLFNGVTLEGDGGFMSPNSSLEGLAGLESKSFTDSAFHQAMLSDLRGTRHLTTTQHQRAGERLMDFPPSYYEDTEVAEKLWSLLSSIGFDVDQLRPRSANVQRSNSAKRHTSKTKSMSALDRRNSLDELDEAQGPPSPEKRDKEWKRNLFNLSSPVDSSHAFVKYTAAGNQQFCEYCFKRYERNPDDSSSPYRCESCTYICHRNCRNFTRVNCVKVAVTKEADLDTEVAPIEISFHQAVKREIEIEMKIRDGLERITRAKAAFAEPKMSLTFGAGSKSSSPAHSRTPSGTKKQPKLSAAEQDILMQIEKSNKKLDVLKNELQRCQVQFSALLTASVASQEDLNPETFNPKADGLDASATAKEQGEVVKVVYVDPTQKSESTKVVFVVPETTVKQLIDLAREMMEASEIIFEIRALNISTKDDVPMRQQDKVLQSSDGNHNFWLTAKFNHASARIDSSPEELEQIQKQNAVLFEIIETETSYVEDLRNLIGLFMKPMMINGMLGGDKATELFSTIKQIAELHELMLIPITELKETASDKSDFVLSVVRVFQSQIEGFSCYNAYCGNQNHSRRLLGRLKAEPTFSKFVAQCEANPRLNKLNLSDLLVKPMHRITRYPILLKRLLSHTLDQRTSEAINGLINKLEERVNDVNAVVGKNESSYRITYIDENLDFNNVTERFRLANGERELVSEKPFTYVKRNLNTVDVVVMLFTDLVLITRPKRAQQFVLFKLPIPLESALFMDCPDTEESKNCFQIVHLQTEQHNMQAISATDKNTYLLQAEATRRVFVSRYLDYEQMYMNNAQSTADSLDSPTVYNDPSPTSQTPRRRFTTLSDRSKSREENESFQRASSWSQLFRSARSVDVLNASRSANGELLLSDLNETTLSSSLISPGMQIEPSHSRERENSGFGDYASPLSINYPQDPPLSALSDRLYYATADENDSDGVFFASMSLPASGGIEIAAEDFYGRPESRIRPAGRLADRSEVSPSREQDSNEANIPRRKSDKSDHGSEGKRKNRSSMHGTKKKFLSFIGGGSSSGHTIAARSLDKLLSTPLKTPSLQPTTDRERK
ncbi:hypothetical protein BJ742DRAFT_733571 [Cladochytrium replicatum]|nr:hypothetical protein BJ742DRAFT_733571 [Cladochytrium replicatum]